MSPNMTPRPQDKAHVRDGQSLNQRATKSRPRAEADGELQQTSVQSRRDSRADRNNAEPDQKASFPSSCPNTIPTLDGTSTEKWDSVQESTGNTESTSSHRLSSARKARFDMKLAGVEVVNAGLDEHGSGLSPSANRLYEAIQSIDQQRRVFPSAIRHLMRAATRGLDADMFYYEDSDDKESTEIHCSRWHRVVQVLDAAAECKHHDYPDSAWNSEVRSSMLRIALEDRDASRPFEVWYKDLTSARISERDLLPNIAGLDARSKMVDYGIVIQPPKKSTLEASIKRLCRERQLDSVNQTDPNHVRFMPIAISIVTKRAAVEEDQALLQLNIWVSAHFATLARLVGSHAPNEKARVEAKAKATMPALPLLLIQGHDWKFMIAEKDENQITIYGEETIGSTRNCLGIYQILANLQRLAQWVNTDYRRWWTREILGKEQ